jgi:hypothetical protein
MSTGLRRRALNPADDDYGDDDDDDDGCEWNAGHRKSVLELLKNKWGLVGRGLHSERGVLII